MRFQLFGQLLTIMVGNLNNWATESANVTSTLATPIEDDLMMELTYILMLINPFEC